MDSISKDSKTKNKKQLSFREFEGSTNDAWDDIDDDITILSSSPSHRLDATTDEQHETHHVSSKILYFKKHICKLSTDKGMVHFLALNYGGT